MSFLRMRTCPRMAKHLTVPVCSYLDGLLPCLQSEASRKLLKVCFTNIELDQSSVRSFEKAVFRPIVLSDDNKRLLESAEVILGDGPFLRKCLQLIKSAKWVHSTFAGVESITSYACPAPKFTLTRHVGASFGQQMGEYVLAQIMAQERNLFKISSSMQKCKWQWQTSAPRTLPSLTIGVLGAGAIGKRIAEMCKSMGMTVWALTRTKADKVNFIDYNCLLSEFPQMLQSCDYICNVLPSTPQTKGLLDGDILKHCTTKKTVFINVGRGDIISETALVHAINEGWLGGAILDVFENEPLSESSALWKTPGIHLTPHMSGLCTVSETASVFISNLSRYLSGQPLEHVVDFSCGY